jgi:hypothetical protein
MARVVSAEILSALASPRNSSRGDKRHEPREFVVVEPNSVQTAHINDDPGDFPEVRPVHRLSALETRKIRDPARVISWRKTDLPRSLRLEPNEQLFENAHRNEHSSTAGTLVTREVASIEIAQRSALERFGAPWTRCIGWIQECFEAECLPATRAHTRSRRLKGETSPTPNRVKANVASTTNPAGRRIHKAAARTNLLRLHMDRFATNSIRVSYSAMTFPVHRSPGRNHCHIAACTADRSAWECRRQFAITRSAAQGH